MATRIAQYDWLTPWEAVEESDADLADELAREVPPGHCLFGIAAVPLAMNTAPHRYDDFLFAVDLPDHKFALVHFTWAKETNPEFPFTALFRDWDHFCADAMIPDHEEHLLDQ